MTSPPTPLRRRGEEDLENHVPAESLEEDSAVKAINSFAESLTGDSARTVYPNFSNDHRLLARDFTIRLYIRYHDSHDCHDANNARRQLDLLDIRDVEEEYSSGKAGCNYIIANVGFESLFKLQQIPNDLFVCEV